MLIVVVNFLMLDYLSAGLYEGVDYSNPNSQSLADILNPYQNAAVVDVIYGVIIAQDYFRQRLAASKNLLFEMEQELDLYELQVINKIKSNSFQEQLILQKLTKHFVPKRNCLDSIIDYLGELSQSIAEPFTHSSINSFLYARDQLQFRSQCFARLLGFEDVDIDLMSDQEIEVHELVTEYTNDEWDSVNKLMRNLDFSKIYWGQREQWEQDPEFLEIQMQRWLQRAQKGIEDLRRYFYPLQELSQIIFKEQEEDYKRRLQNARDHERFLKQQIQYNWETLKQEQESHRHLSELQLYVHKSLDVKQCSNNLIKEQTIKAKLMKEVDEETRDLLEKTAKLSDSYYLEQLELNDEKVKLIEAEKQETIYTKIDDLF